jgi:hypothetical protein
VLLDECLPKRFAEALQGHDVWTVPQAGWAGLKNGALLARVEGRFDAFVTVDANLPNQHDLVRRSFSVIVLRVQANTLKALLPLAPEVNTAIAAARPGEVRVISAA